MRKDKSATPTMCAKDFVAYGKVIKTGPHAGQRRCKRITKAKKAKKAKTTTTTTTTTAATVTAKPSTTRKKKKKKLSEMTREEAKKERVRRELAKLSGGRSKRR